MKFVLILCFIALAGLGTMAVLEFGNSNYSWSATHSTSVTDYLPQFR
jgi:hypothetical protein